MPQFLLKNWGYYNCLGCEVKEDDALTILRTMPVNIQVLARCIRVGGRDSHRSVAMFVMLRNKNCPVFLSGFKLDLSSIPGGGPGHGIRG